MVTFLLVMLVVVVLLLIEIPVAFAFGIGAVLFPVLTGNNISFLVPHGFNTASGFALLALPLFVLAGTLMAVGGISERLLDFVNSFVGRIKGGLGAVTVVTCALFGAISGSSSAAIAAIGQIMIPRMVREGYPEGHATALVACSSVLALLIPPSIPMIVFSITGGISVGAAFLSTIIPGILLAIVYCGLNFWFLRNNDSISVAPQLSFAEAGKGVMMSGYRASFALLMPLLILGVIYSGIATPTEAAAIAVIYAIPVGMYIYKGLTLKSLGNATIRAVITTGSILAVLFFLFIMSRAMILESLSILRGGMAGWRRIWFGNTSRGPIRLACWNGTSPCRCCWRPGVWKRSTGRRGEFRPFGRLARRRPAPRTRHQLWVPSFPKTVAFRRDMSFAVTVHGANAKAESIHEGGFHRAGQCGWQAGGQPAQEWRGSGGA